METTCFTVQKLSKNHLLKHHLIILCEVSSCTHLETRSPCQSSSSASLPNLMRMGQSEVSIRSADQSQASIHLMRMGWSRELRAGVYTASWLELAFSLHTDTVLYCTVLYCTVLYCTVLYCTVLYCRSSSTPGSGR